MSLGLMLRPILVYMRQHILVKHCQESIDYGTMHVLSLIFNNQSNNDDRVAQQQNTQQCTP